MKIIFNDLTELQIQAAAVDNGRLDVKTIDATPEELRNIFEDELKIKKMKVVEQGRVIAEYSNYTIMDGLTEYAGKIYGVFMYQKGNTPEDYREKLDAVIALASMQAQSLDKEDAVKVMALFPKYEEGADYTDGQYVVHDGDLCKVQEKSGTLSKIDVELSLSEKITRKG